MCDPITLAQGGLSAIKSIGAIGAQNRAAVQNAANATQAMNDELTQTTGQYIEQHRSLIQGGFDAILEGRAAESAAYTSAIENGVQGASVKASLRAQTQKTARSTVRTNQEIKSLGHQVDANYRHVRAKAQDRINSVPTTKFGLGDIAGVLAPIVKGEME